MKKDFSALIPFVAILLLLVAATLSGCVTTKPVVKNGDVRVSFLGIKKKEDVERVHVRLSHSENYDGIVQEIYMSNGQILVEYFSNGSDDFHWIKAEDHARVMIVYPADVRGTDAAPSGFAHLPANQNGTVHTDVHHKFNEWYQKSYDTRGRVVRSKRDNVTIWFLRWKNGKVTFGSEQFENKK